MAPSPITRLRRICLALPDAEEIETWETPTFRIRGKIFALVQDDAVWLKAPKGSQEILLEAAPDRFFRPPYLGHKGWVGMRLAGAVDWAEVTALVRRSFSLVAPRRIAATVAQDRAASAV
ncbi:MmcQ/YjbR family DNA-binding protein [Falsiroseomonas stagni]|uniref:Predicted DNA-binding protein, MmcQ/YjbR family n=1 Tax=Falsiroseomonas stagni DSM 19981 TaxID=1123062 RepID=A0A1I4FF83_9PROT|nr:MmcQ/YjbR family DNA-binding protein [Falsiroseomonas stagni]SFL15101.1 Predicted DNA-binding protein, MmcQ/YjbR family [Falsiroseomonas stagni DSM 19981]